MTKSETRECLNIVRYIGAGMIDTAARAASALYRSARTVKSQNAILAFAMTHQLVSRADWIA